MKPTKGYYCLIQYCPDLSRLEAANLGVFLFCPEHHFLKTRTDQTAQRIRQFFGLEDGEKWRIDSLRVSIEERLRIEGQNIQSLEDLEHFIATRANKIQITAPRSMKVHDMEKDLEELFERLVKAPVQFEYDETIIEGISIASNTHRTISAGLQDMLAGTKPYEQRPSKVAHMAAWKKVREAEAKLNMGNEGVAGRMMGSAKNLFNEKGEPNATLIRASR